MTHLALDGLLRACQHQFVVRPEDQSLVNNNFSSGSPRRLFNVSDTRKCILLSALLVALVTATFLPVLQNDFIVYDDPVYVTDNVHVQQGISWDNISWAFRNIEASNWHPVTWVSHLLDVEMFGLNPKGHHISSLIIHAANTVLLFLLFKGMTGAIWRSVLLAAFFGLHPLRVESVAWVSERKDVLSAFFWMLTLLAYVRYARRKRAEGCEASAESVLATNIGRPAIDYFVALLCFCLGLMSKPMLVTLPWVLLLLDYWPLQRVPGFWSDTSCSETSGASRPALVPLLLEKVPFFLIALAVSGVTLLVQKHSGAVQSDLPLIGRTENAGISYTRYIEKLFCPLHLSVIYPYVNHWPILAVISSVLLLVAVSALVTAFGCRQPYLPVGWFWFVGTLVPVIGLVQVGRQSMADRYTYIPSIGLLLLLIWGAHAVVIGARFLRVAFAGAAGVLILFAIGLTHKQIGYWKNSQTLFRHAIATTENNYIAHYCLGFTLEKEGRSDEAIAEYEQALKLYPEYADAHNNLGFILRKKGQLDEAIGHFQEALRLNSWHVLAHFNYGFALSQQGRVDEAIDQYRQALQLKPAYPDALNNLGVALGRKGRVDEAIVAFQEAAQWQPRSAEIRYNLANALFRRNRTDEAVQQFQQVLNLQPGHAEARNNLGVALSRQRRLQEAVIQFQEALRLKPDYVEAQKNLAVALRAKSLLENEPSALKPR